MYSFTTAYNSINFSFNTIFNHITPISLTIERSLLTVMCMPFTVCSVHSLLFIMLHFDRDLMCHNRKPKCDAEGRSFYSQQYAENRGASCEPDISTLLCEL